MLCKTLNTERLRLRPSSAADVFRAYEIYSDWQVSRMLRMAAYPPLLDDVTAWFGIHEQEWMSGSAYRFAVDLHGRMIGLVDVDGVTDSEGSLGYWLERTAWGQGFAFEAAHAVVRYAFDDVGLLRLRSGHAADNPASGRVLTKLGFGLVDRVARHSRSRGADIEQCRCLLERNTST